MIQVQIDPVNSGRLIFNQPITLSEATQYLWAKPPASPSALKPDPGESLTKNGKHKWFLIDKGDMQLLFSLQHGLANEYLGRLQHLQSKGTPKLPGWVPQQIREDALAGKLPNGVSRFPGQLPYGRIVVWCDKSGWYWNIQVYQEFPEALDFYVQLADGNERTGRLWHYAYTSFNRDMTTFLDRGLSPEMARDEIRRVNDEVFKLILEGCLAIIASGTGISGFNSAMRQNARKLSDAMERATVSGGRGSARLTQQIGRELVAQMRSTSKKVVVNLGGTGEVAEAINLNPNIVAQRKDIPNLVAKEGELIAEVFDANTIDSIVSNRLPPDTLDWRRIIPGMHKVLKPGSPVTIRFQGTGGDAAIIVAEMKRLGFKEIKDWGGAVIEAVK